MPECSKCHKPIEKDCRFCPSCGTPVSLVEQTVTSTPKEHTPKASQKDPVGSVNVHGRFEPGTRLGTRYRIVGLLGRGGMGEVYRADDLELGQSVALKFLTERVAGDPIALERFRGEVRNARKIAHPNVCRMYDIGEVDGHVFLSMEYIDGEDLAHVLKRMGRPSEEKSLEIARQLCLGLAAAHENGVLHRDLKPANIMIDGRGRVRITDFGLAGLAEELNTTKERVGTPAYMAPEQLEDGTVSVHSDIYTLGLVLYELFTGHRLHDTNDVSELKSLHSSASITKPSSSTHPLDPAIERAIEHCLEHDPQQRPQSVYVVLGALPGADPLAAALAAGETPSPELVANARDAGGLRPTVAISLLAAMLAFLAITYYVHAGKTVMPERSPATLSVVAEQLMEELGYTDLPVNTVSGFDVNTQLSESLRTSPHTYKELALLDWPPRFRYWRRWTKGDFIPAHFHAPEYFAINGLTTMSNGTATIALDSTGRLLGLLVESSSIDDESRPAIDVDWSIVFRLANLAESDAVKIPLIKTPPVYCDEVVSWRIEGSGETDDPITIQMGANGSRPNYFEILGLDEAMVPKNIDGITTMTFPWYVVFTIQLIMYILAWRNLRASRGDRRNAFRCALIIGGLYALMEFLSTTPDQIIYWTWEGFGRGAGHVLIHFVRMWVVYMAIEPYVRRVWPRMLVGLVRLLSGRLHDPAIGREVLIGVVTGCGLVTILTLTTSAAWIFQEHSIGQLSFFAELWNRLSPIIFSSTTAHRIAWSVAESANIAALLIAIRLLTRHTPTAFVVSVVVLGGSALMWYMNWHEGSIWLALTYATCLGMAMATLYTKVGILSGIVTVFVVRQFGLYTTDFGSWYTPYCMAELGILLALAAYGFWVAIAGQPLFKDSLLADKPARV